VSAATDLLPVVYIPSRARQPELVCRPAATVIALHRPSVQSVAPPVRLTRRGALVLAAVLGLLGAALLCLAARSAPAGANGAAAVGAAPAVVEVHAGDTLWSIATRVAPRADPRAEVAALQRMNHLHGADVMPGQLLRTR
jgi:hypothetical protein